MSNDPFTLDIFGNTALSSGLGLGVTAFGEFSPAAANDDDPEPTPPAPPPAMPVASTPIRRTGLRANFYLEGDRGLPSSWKDRARANVAAILVANNVSKQDRPATSKEQAQLIRFTGFGAGELANGMFRRPGKVDFRQGWDDLGSSLQTAVSEADYASLARCTPNMPISRRSSSSGRSGPDCSAWDGAAAASLNRVSAQDYFQR